VAAQTDGFPALIHLDQPAAQRVERLGTGDAPAFPKWSPDGTQLVGAIDVRDGQQAGFRLYSLRAKRTEKVSNRGVSPQWLPDGKRILFFEKNIIGMLDLDTRRVTTVPFTPLPGVDLQDVNFSPWLSRDGSMLLVRQTLEQGDIWTLQTEKNNGGQG